MTMKYTSAQANKRLKKLTDEYVSLREKESRSREFRAPPMITRTPSAVWRSWSGVSAASSTPSTCSTSPIPYPAST